MPRSARRFQWLEPLLERHAAAVLPVLTGALRAEWHAEADYSGNLLSHFAHTQEPIPPVLQSVLQDLVTGTECARDHARVADIETYLKASLEPVRQALAES